MRAPVTFPDEPEPDRPSFAQPTLTWTRPATIIRSWIGRGLAPPPPPGRRDHHLDPSVTALQDDPDPIDSYVEAALKAFAEASDLDELRAAKRAHIGSTSPLALAFRAAAELPPERRRAHLLAVEEAQFKVDAAAEFRRAVMEGGSLSVVPPMPDPTPLPDGPFVWVLTLGPDADLQAVRDNFQAVRDGLPEDVRAKSRWICLAHGYTLQILDDDALRQLGLQRIEAR